jgi:hypothetical protein
MQSDIATGGRACRARAMAPPRDSRRAAIDRKEVAYFAGGGGGGGGGGEQDTVLTVANAALICVAAPSAVALSC